MTLLAALKHPLASGGMGQRDFRRRVRALERGLLRGPRLAGGLDGWLAASASATPRPPGRRPCRRGAAAWLERLVEAARPFAVLAAQERPRSAPLLDAHLAFAEWLAADAAGDAGELWARRPAPARTSS